MIVVNTNVSETKLLYVPVLKHHVFFAVCSLLLTRYTSFDPLQEVNATLHCHLGIGREHAKWSPVGTASYRLLPEIVIKERVVGKQAERLQKCFTRGVIELVEDKGRFASVTIRYSSPHQGARYH